MKQAQALITTNAPAILTGVGVVGVAGTAYFTGRASFKAADVLQREKNKRSVQGITDNTTEELTVKEKALLIWTLYLPAAGVASATIVAIIYANRINAKRMAALLTAYAATDRAYSEYKDKVKEHLTGTKEEKIRSEIAQDRVNQEYGNSEQIFSPLDGKVLIREDYTGRYFWSSIDEVDRATNDINMHVIKEKSARLSDFYDLLGLDHVSTSDYFGFTTEEPMELNWTTCTSPDGKLAVHSFEYVNHPVMNPENQARPFR